MKRADGLLIMKKKAENLRKSEPCGLSCMSDALAHSGIIGDCLRLSPGGPA